ncbi:MAG TPA: TetR/AcrR family transcriptional regulator [Promineifilum sp.]|nr:TetR/AcrR family transcriptional regulator [Promineifilum sp.]
MKKRPEATALTRENIMQAFWSLYCQKKIDHISIKEITDKAGYHRSTFYEYFVDIYDLLNQLEDEVLARMRAEVLQSLSIPSNSNLVQILADRYEAQGEYLRVLLGENGNPHFAKKVKAEMGVALTRRFGLPENDSHTAYIMEFGLSAIISTITHWYQNSKDLPFNELVVLIRSMLLDGVFPMLQKYSTLPSDSLLPE